MKATASPPALDSGIVSAAHCKHLYAASTGNVPCLSFVFLEARGTQGEPGAPRESQGSPSLAFPWVPLPPWVPLASSVRFWFAYIIFAAKVDSHAEEHSGSFTQNGSFTSRANVCTGFSYLLLAPGSSMLLLAPPRSSCLLLDSPGSSYKRVMLSMVLSALTLSQVSAFKTERFCNRALISRSAAVPGWDL